MMKILGATFIGGATAYEGQIGRVWFGVYRPRFMRTSGLGFVRLAPKGDE